MKITKEQRAILEYLVKNPETKIQDICNHVNYGNVKVKKNISQLMIFLKNYDSEIILVKGAGLYFKTSYSKEQWSLIINKNTQVSTDERIMISICKRAEVQTMQNIANEFFVTPSRINKVLHKMETEGVKVLRLKKVGIIINESLVERKRLIAKILNKYVDKYSIKDSLSNLFLDLFSCELDDDDFVIADKVVNKISFTIRSNEYNYYLIMALLERVIPPQKIIKNSEICSLFKTSLDISTIEYWESRFEPVQTEKNFEKIVVDLITYIEKKEGTLYDFEYSTFELLCYHIETIYLKKNVGTKIGMMEEQKIIERFALKYPQSYETGRHAVEFLSNLFEYQLDDSEIFYVGLYFQLHKETNVVVKKLKAIVVCEYGLAMSSFLRVQIENNFPSIVVTDTYSLNEYHLHAKNISENIDVIFTTIKTMGQIDNVMTIVVTPIDFDTELPLIKSKLTHYRINEFITRTNLCDNIEISRTFRDYNDIYNHVLDKYNDCINESYMQSVKLREANETTIIKNIWFPHGNPKEVIKSQITIISLSNPLRINEVQIDIIVWLMITEEDAKKYTDIVRMFYGIFTNPNLPLFNQKISSADHIKTCICEALINY